MELAAMNIAFGTKAFSLAPATGFPKEEWELLWSSLFRKNTGKIVVTSEIRRMISTSDKPFTVNFEEVSLESWDLCLFYPVKMFLLCSTT